MKNKKPAPESRDEFYLPVVPPWFSQS